jgi:hypothetical protein
MNTTIDTLLATANDAIITVGAGRGFLVEAREARLVVTAAHCLPRLPPPHLAAYPHQRTYRKLLGPLEADAPSVWAECLFVDLIADLAVLGEPDGQAYCGEHDAYAAFVEDRSALSIGAVTQRGPGWLLTLGGQWARCTFDVGVSLGNWVGCLGIADTTPEAMAPGTSGSPILTADGRAVGLISVEKDLNPVLANSLPAWLVAELKQPRMNV